MDKDRIKVLENEIKTLKKENQRLKEANENYKKEVSFLKGIYEFNPYAIALFDAEGYYIDSNESYSKLFMGNIPPKCYSLFKDPIAEKTGMKETINKAKKSKVVIPEVCYKPHEVDHNIKENIYLYFKSVMFPIFDKNKKLEKIVTMYEDISNQRKMEQEIIKNRNLESLGLLAGGIAHDFNNMLTGAMGNIYLAKLNLNSKEDLLPFLEKAENSYTALKDLSLQLLTFSKGGTPVKETSSIEELIEDISKFGLRGTDVNYEISTSENLKYVDIDRAQIGQVIFNLLINAKQSMRESGTIKIKIENISSKDKPFLAENKDYIKVCIQDQGEGISPENISKIFDPYFTTKEDGHGIGLATVYSILKKHDGYIDVDSNPGVGSTFYIYLPVSENQTIPFKKNTDERIKGSGHLLIMDDEEDIRNSLKKLLNDLGYEVTVTSDGIQVLEEYKKAKVQEKPFDLLLLDLTVPGGMGGKRTIQELKIIDPEVKVIVMSAYSKDPVATNYIDYGFLDFISKPYKLGDLSQKINKIIKGEHSLI